jgi:palmitoyl-protein thioesterase
MPEDPRAKYFVVKNSTKMFIRSLLLTILLAALVSTQAPVTHLPVGIVPGLGDFCLNPISMMRVIGEMKHNVSNEIFCIDSAPFLESYITSFDSQVQRACNIVARHAEKYNLKDGWIVMGLSQGGLTARAIIEKCEHGQYAKKLITLGGTHQGVAQIPKTGKSMFDNLINGIVDEVVYNPLIQKVIGPAGYVHRIDDDGKKYSESSIALADLNNAGPNKNPQYKQRIANLDAVVLIMFSRDTMIIPKETAHFGFYKDHTRTDVVALEDSDLLKNDDIGLKALSEAGKIH